MPWTINCDVCLMSFLVMTKRIINNNYIFRLGKTNTKMSIFLNKPNITLETEQSYARALIVGNNSTLESTLREILISKGVDLNERNNFDYIFQLGSLEKNEFFLKQAINTGAKYFLILDEHANPKLSQNAEKRTLEFIQKRNLSAKIFKVSGILGQEIEVVKKILKYSFGQTKDEVINLTGVNAFWEKPKSDSQREQKKGSLPYTLVSILIMFFILTSPILFILSNIFLGTLALKNTKSALLTSKFVQAKSLSRSARAYFASAESGFRLFIPILSFLNQDDKSREIENWLQVGQDLGQASEHLVDVGQEGQTLALSILGQKQVNLEEMLPKISTDISLNEREFATLETRTQNPPGFLSEDFKQIKTIRKGLSSLQNFLLLAPDILGLKENQTYLVLFQNNFELRPGGGFIGTVGFLTLNEGKMDLKIEDVYTVDGQLRGHVEPPAPLRAYLNQIHWYLRDSNWDPDFPSNARRASWFLEKEIGVKTDGVIALDLSLVKKILTLTGPISIVDYQEKINDENLFLKTQIYTQEKFFPGSTQKKDFISSLTTTLFDKLTAGNDFPWLGLVKIANEGINEKHLAVFFNDDLAEKLVSEQGWGGELTSVGCAAAEVMAGEPTSNYQCIGDYLMVVDANLGVNKSNFFVKRSVNKSVNLTQNSLDSTVDINYSNTSPAGVNFSGVYKNYLRILVPAEESLIKAMVDDREINPSDVEKTMINDKQSIGFLVEIPTGEKRKVEIFLRRSLNLPTGNFIYQLSVQKQAGTESDPFNIVVSTPSWQILETNFPTLVKSGIVSYNSDLLIDRVFTIKLKQ